MARVTLVQGRYFGTVATWTRLALSRLVETFCHGAVAYNGRNFCMGSYSQFITLTENTACETLKRLFLFCARKNAPCCWVALLGLPSGARRLDPNKV